MKGIEPLVATIALIIIAVSTAVMVANWQAWFLPSYAGQLANTSRTQLQCARAGLALDNITYDCRGNCLPGVMHTLTAKIRNAGDISLPLYSLYVQTSGGELFSFALNTTLELDQVLDLENVSSMDCRAINRSVSRVSVLSACTDLPAFDGSMIKWINC